MSRPARLRIWHALPRLAAAAALSTVLVVSGCGDPAEEPTPPEDLTPVSEQPEPDPTTPPPAGAVTDADLPEELVWGDAVLAPAPESSDPNEQFSACQQNTLKYLGANATVARTYGPDAPDGVTKVVVMSFDDAEGAEFATSELHRWIDTCDEILRNGREATETRRLTDNEPVDVPAGEAVLDEWSWTSDQGTQSEIQGVVRVDNRVALVATSHMGQPQPMEENINRVVDALQP